MVLEGAARRAVAGHLHVHCRPGQEPAALPWGIRLVGSENSLPGQSTRIPGKQAQPSLDSILWSAWQPTNPNRRMEILVLIGARETLAQGLPSASGTLIGLANTPVAGQPRAGPGVSVTSSTRPLRVDFAVPFDICRGTTGSTDIDRFLSGGVAHRALRQHPSDRGHIFPVFQPSVTRRRIAARNFDRK